MEGAEKRSKYTAQGGNSVSQVENSSYFIAKPCRVDNGELQIVAAQFLHWNAISLWEILILFRIR